MSIADYSLLGLDQMRKVQRFVLQALETFLNDKPNKKEKSKHDRQQVQQLRKNKTRFPKYVNFSESQVLQDGRIT